MKTNFKQGVHIRPAVARLTRGVHSTPFAEARNLTNERTHYARSYDNRMFGWREYLLARTFEKPATV